MFCSVKATEPKFGVQQPFESNGQRLSRPEENQIFDIRGLVRTRVNLSYFFGSGSARDQLHELLFFCLVELKIFSRLTGIDRGAELKKKRGISRERIAAAIELIGIAAESQALNGFLFCLLSGGVEVDP